MNFHSFVRSFVRAAANNRTEAARRGPRRLGIPKQDERLYSFRRRPLVITLKLEVCGERLSSRERLGLEALSRIWCLRGDWQPDAVARDAEKVFKSAGRASGKIARDAIPAAETCLKEPVLLRKHALSGLIYAGHVF